MTNKSKRTHPLDRDGDGTPGGSLPGNQTAPMADAVDDLADARTTPGNSPEKLEAIEREADQANAAARGDRPDDLGADRPDTFDAEQVEAASQAGEGAKADEVKARVNATLDGWKAEADEIRAARAKSEISDAARTMLADGLITIPTDTAPVAVRLHELRILVGARRLYRSAEGYSATYGAPYIDQATIDAWIAAGLAEDVPSAGNMGGVRVTAEGRSALNRAPADEAA